VVGDGNTLVDQTFNTASAAVTYFTNHAIDLGSLSSGALSGNTLSLTITETLTTTATGTSFDGGFLIGDPPPASGGAKPNATGAPIDQLAQHMASFGAEHADLTSSSLNWTAWDPQTTIASSHLQHAA
jgi:hypothetical protein